MLGYANRFERTMHVNRLEQPPRRKRPTVYFGNSMSDLFHERVTNEFLDQVFQVIEATPWHTFQILTKRAERLAEYFHSWKCPTNVWLGVSAEDKKHGTPRIAYLRKVAARLSFCPSSLFLRISARSI